MSATPPHDPGGPPSPLDGPSSGDEVPPVATAAGPPRGLLLAAAGVVVALEPGGHLDFAVHLRTDQEVQLLSLADDGIETSIEVFAPDGSSEGSWVGGEPGVVNGLEWYLPGEPLPATGTYVIRVIHMGGDHRPFALGFFGNA